MRRMPHAARVEQSKLGQLGLAPHRAGRRHGTARGSRHGTARHGTGGAGGSARGRGRRVSGQRPSKRVHRELDPASEPFEI